MFLLSQLRKRKKKDRWERKRGVSLLGEVRLRWIAIIEVIGSIG